MSLRTKVETFVLLLTAHIIGDFFARLEYSPYIDSSPIPLSAREFGVTLGLLLHVLWHGLLAACALIAGRRFDIISPVVIFVSHLVIDMMMINNLIDQGLHVSVLGIIAAFAPIAFRKPRSGRRRDS